MLALLIRLMNMKKQDKERKARPARHAYVQHAESRLDCCCRMPLSRLPHLRTHSVRSAGGRKTHMQAGRQGM